MRVCSRFLAGPLVLAAILIIGHPLAGRESSEILSKTGDRGMDKVYVFDGSGVHDVGMLHVHTGNWGSFGSYPSSTWSIGEFPSAEWPANSGIEYLYIGGLWVGAIKNGFPAVSTAAFEMEFAPTEDPVDIIYSSFENAPGGNRFPSPNADDDGDGLIDEDWLDGHDNDMDGLIDEDYAAISRQMFSSWCTDDQPAVLQRYPDHTPLNILIRQESYQWEDERLDDFVGFKYTITNIGDEPLEDIYLGLFIDGDAGPRNESPWLGDASGRWAGTVCTEMGPAAIDLGYVYDVDGDGGRTPGYLGAMILGHSTDPSGVAAPKTVGMTSFQIFAGDNPFENGGDPTNDFERYELMSRRQFDHNTVFPRDYRMLLSTGDFEELLPGQSLVFYVGLVAGEGLDGMLENAAMAQAFFNGQWFDLDDDPMTGTDRRETPVYGPATGVIIDICRLQLSEPVDIPYGEMLWINGDCETENKFKLTCGYSEADSLLFRTGVAGRETQVHWLAERPELSLDLLDIRPGSCPNPFNVGLFEGMDDSGKIANRGNKRGGVLPVALLGSEDFDVRLVDATSVRLEGVMPVPRKRCSYEDLSQPVIEKTGCECTTEGPDGYEDMIFHFGNLEIAEALAGSGIPQPGEEAVLTLTGQLTDGTSFMFSDCLRFVGRGPKADHNTDRPVHNTDRPVLRAALPNPFNPVTRISFYLPGKQHIQLEIFDVSGRLVKRLADGVYQSGETMIEWKATGISSGIYFYRLKTNDYVETKKIVLMR
ncbi:MAG: T9SS type A sorting domain-containing protein [Candidatus Krumholzibacteria bacterium]|nr:T9SS type A sorting domain-containing protein [Candidatus Krumholzibacteria bacterium]